MIGLIQGPILQKNVPKVLIDIHGLGYEVETTMTTFFQLPEVGERVQLFTHFTVREDAQILYGFLEEAERMMFRTLIKVNSIGPKLALAILSSIAPSGLVHSIREGDSVSLTRLPGVGKKTAERLIVEMRDKLSDWEINSPPAESSQITHASQVNKEAITALVALGYKPQEASRALAKIEAKDLTAEELIRAALKAIAQEL